MIDYRKINYFNKIFMFKIILFLNYKNIKEMIIKRKTERYIDEISLI